MNLSDLTTELGARGFDYLTEARRTYFLNQAYLTDICESEEWPFLEATATGASPLAITDLRVIESVIDEDQQVKLTPLTRKAITDLSPDLDQPGNPELLPDQRQHGQYLARSDQHAYGSLPQGSKRTYLSDRYAPTPLPLAIPNR